MLDPIDLLQIKIEKAKQNLSDETLNAIGAVDWKAVIFSLREKKGYSFEQLGDLEIETELVLCGLLSPENYPKELQARMKLGKAQTDELVNEMNEMIFSKIRAELIKNSERKKIFKKDTEAPESFAPETPIPSNTPMVSTLGVVNKDIETKPDDAEILNKAGIEIVEPNPANNTPIVKSEEIKKEESKPHPILAQKLTGTYKAPVVETAHSLDNITKAEIKNPDASYPKSDPYRLTPE